MKKIILVTLACFVLQSQYVAAEVSGVKKEDWLRTLKPIEVQTLCIDSPIQRKFSGSYQECTQVVAKLFDKCGHEVYNVKIPDVLTSRQEGEKYGGIMGECIAAYYFGGEHLSLFNRTQAAFAK
ncbi:MAG: hypothetical protein ACAH12_01145 [Methylophilaceae bacterium]